MPRRKDYIEDWKFEDKNRAFDIRYDAETRKLDWIGEWLDEREPKLQDILRRYASEGYTDDEIEFMEMEIRTQLHDKATEEWKRIVAEQG